MDAGDEWCACHDRPLLRSSSGETLSVGTAQKRILSCTDYPLQEMYVTSAGWARAVLGESPKGILLQARPPRTGMYMY